MFSAARRGRFLGARLIANGRIVHISPIGTCLPSSAFCGFELVFDQNEGHLRQLRGQTRGFLRVLKGLFMLIELGKYGAKLKDEPAVIAGEVD